MAPDCAFFKLPRELRDIIYVFYVNEDGYLFNFGSCKLRTTRNAPIDLALTYSCRQVAEEMKGLALETNVITFSTIYSEECTIRAYRFTNIWLFLRMFKDKMLNNARHLINKDIADQVIQRFPKSSSLLRLLVELPRLPDRLEHAALSVPHRVWNPAPSIIREFNAFTIDLISMDTNFVEAVKDAGPFKIKSVTKGLLSLRLSILLLGASQPRMNSMKWRV